jgi:hypothetical protein
MQRQLRRRPPEGGPYKFKGSGEYKSDVKGDPEGVGLHSVITDFTRFLGRSTSQPLRTA